MTASGSEIRLSNLSTGKINRVTADEINNICQILGVDANFLFGIQPMKCNETPETKFLNRNPLVVSSEMLKSLSPSERVVLMLGYCNGCGAEMKNCNCNI